MFSLFCPTHFLFHCSLVISPIFNFILDVSILVSFFCWIDDPLLISQLLLQVFDCVFILLEFFTLFICVVFVVVFCVVIFWVFDPLLNLVVVVLVDILTLFINVFPPDILWDKPQVYFRLFPEEILQVHLISFFCEIKFWLHVHLGWDLTSFISWLQIHLSSFLFVFWFFFWDELSVMLFLVVIFWVKYS